MNNKERARELLNSLYGWNPKIISVVDAEADYESVVELISAVRAEALEEAAKICDKKREECNEDQHDPCYCHEEDAAAIRARGKE